MSSKIQILIYNYSLFYVSMIRRYSWHLFLKNSFEDSTSLFLSDYVTFNFVISFIDIKEGRYVYE